MNVVFMMVRMKGLSAREVVELKNGCVQREQSISASYHEAIGLINGLNELEVADVAALVKSGRVAQERIGQCTSLLIIEHCFALALEVFLRGRGQLCCDAAVGRVALVGGYACIDLGRTCKVASPCLEERE